MSIYACTCMYVYVCIQQDLKFFCVCLYIYDDSSIIRSIHMMFNPVCLSVCVCVLSQAVQVKKSQEQALVTAVQQLEALQKKEAGVESSLAEVKGKLAGSEKTVRERMERVDTLSSEVRKLASRK